MMKAEMVNSSNHTSATVDETVETQTIDIDMDLLKKEQDASADPNETWTGLNDSCDNIRGDGDETVKSGSVTSEPKRQFSRRNSNESVCSKGSTGSAGSKSSSKSASKRKSMTKRRSWKKPKDKPKRPLSAYNIFFKHTRSRIVEGLPEQGTTQETIASIEGIVANSTETRRHRKTHGQISFGDLARTIADKWKTIDQDHRALFDHYAALDMKRYRREVSIWKAKKEAEALAASGDGGAKSSINLDVSGISTDSQASLEGGDNYNDWNTMQARAFDTSFKSVDSDDDFGIVEPLPIADSHEYQSGMIGNAVPSFIGSSSNGNMNNMMAADNVLSMNASNNGYGNNMNNDSIQSRKLQDIWMKNRQLEDSINKLKKELSATNFQLGNGGNNMNMNNNPESNSNAKFMNSPFQGGPSIDRMQQLHRRRLMMGDILPQMANGQIHPNQLGMNGNNNNTSGNFGQGGLGGNNEMQMDPFDMNPVPFEEVFNANGDEASMKKRELITNLNQIDFFGNGGGN